MKDALIDKQGQWDAATIYYPRQEEIKKEFFIKLKSWRALLRSFLNKTYANKYSLDEIDLMTQKIIDRLIFIDFCADNSILAQNRLNGLLHSMQDKWYELKRIFEDMNDRFNTELFAISDCDKIKITDDVIVPIIQELSAINFKQLSVHIIGEVYENYLGEILKQSRSSVQIQAQREIAHKKSQGIYYTPEYIVKNIVENTVGKILEKCKTLDDIEKIRVLDPACGSGSFLIRVFDVFKFHYDRINQHQTTLFEFDTRRKILQKNIFGVDLDKRAVEIAKLNLMIKALDGISWQDIKGKKLLLSLELNIRCGNSLVSGMLDLDDTNMFFNIERNEVLNKLVELHVGFYKAKKDDEKEANLNEIKINEEMFNRKINKPLSEYLLNLEELRPFNYPVAFPEVFADGGFDCIIGNPPYVGQKDNKSLFEPFKQGQWKEYYERKQDLYYYFYIKGIKLLKPNGLLGFITPQYWLTAFAGKKLRSSLIKEMSLLSVFDVSTAKVFISASINTMVFMFSKNKTNKKILVYFIDDNNALKSYQSIVSNADLNENEWNIFKNQSYVDLVKKNKKYIALGEISTITPGIQTGCDKVSDSHLTKLKISTLSKGQGIFVISSDELKKLKTTQKFDKFIKPWYKNSDIDKYFIQSKNESWGIITNRIDNIKDYPIFENHLLKFKKILDSRFENYALKKAHDDGKWWYLYGYRPDTDFDHDKIVFSYRGVEPKFAYTNTSFYSAMDIYYITNLNSDYNFKVILAILNSKLLKYYFDKNCKKKGSILEFSIEPMSKIPIPIFNKSDLETCKEIVGLIDELGSLKGTKITDTSASAIAREIDKLVYKLYGLDSAEINLLESTLNNS